MSPRSLTPSSQADVSLFIEQAKSLRRKPEARLLFALDATASREATWDYASQVQAAMFAEAADERGLDVQLAWYGGIAGFHHSHWVNDATTLRQTMEGVRCAAGTTQIGRLLSHATGLAREGGLAAVVFVGDSVEEDPQRLYRRAGELRLFRVPMFVFQEGADADASTTFAEIARLTRGAHLRFGAGAADQLRDLLRGVAAYAVGGIPALEELSRKEGGAAVLLTHQLKR